MKRLFSVIALITTVATASALEIDESGSYYCEGEDTVGLVGFGMRKQKNALKHQCLNAVVEQ